MGLYELQEMFLYHVQKSLYPVQWVAEIVASRAADKISVFSFSFYGKKIGILFCQKKKIGKKEKTMFPVSSIIHTWPLGNNIFSKDGLMI